MKKHIFNESSMNTFLTFLFFTFTPFLISGAVFPSLEYNNTMLWGSKILSSNSKAYRPNLYFAMKTKSFSPVSVSILWSPVNRYDRLRWQCDSNDDIFKTWHENNLDSFGSQEIVDGQANLILTTEYVKRNHQHKGGDWTVRVTGKSKTKKAEQLVFYVLAEDRAGLKLMNAKNNGMMGPIQVSGSSKEIGKYSLFVKDASEYKGESFSRLEQLLEKFHFSGKKLGFTKSILYDSLRKRTPDDVKVPIFTFENSVQEGSEYIVIQKIVSTPFTFEMSLLSHDRHKDTSAQKKELVNVSDKKLTQIFEKERKAFAKAFTETFANVSHLKFGQSALSNLLGGVGYFTGSSRHQYGNQEPKMTSSMRSLLTATPSRTFFPRGFLWDEGFHLMVIKKSNKSLFKDILSHWLGLMESDGWIPREQILGDEARLKVPQEFQTQRNDIANPPTIFLSILSLVEDIKRGGASSMSVGIDGTSKVVDNGDLEFLRSIFPKLKKFYGWFFKTQSGFGEGTFSWRGRSKGHTFASGLDDYPRGVGTPQKTEKHLDLYCWMYFMSDAMRQISELLMEQPETFANQAKLLREHLSVNHLNPKTGIHADYVGPVKYHANFTRPEFSPHIGYISLFPLITDILANDSDDIGHIINIISDPKQLYTNFGLRSLSASDKLYGTKENYWRGPIWININYLVLRSLYQIAHRSTHMSERHVKIKELYTTLRNNLINTVLNAWKKNGRFYEQYNPSNGHGQRQSDFTGWTTLILMIMNETY